MFSPLSSLRLVFALAVLLIFTGCHRDGDPSEAAKVFFDRLAHGKVKEAYDSGAFGFQTLQSPVAFESNAREMGLVGSKSVQLQPAVIDGRMAKITVEVTPATGEKSTLIVTLEREHGDWRIYAIKTPRSIETGIVENRFTLVGKGLAFNDATNQPMPDDKTVRRLTKDSLLEFNKAIRAHEFKDFYDSVSTAWQAQLTEKQLQTAFQGFIDKDVDISGIKDLEPVYDGIPIVSSDGLLLVSGHFDTKPVVVIFSLKFMYELPDWKLFGLDVDLRAP